jgi:hypothetical protein
MPRGRRAEHEEPTEQAASPGRAEPKRERARWQEATGPSVNSPSVGPGHGEQRAGETEVSGFVHSGPRFVVASGSEIMASGPA